MTEEQIIAAIATMLQFTKSPMEADVNIVARIYRENLKAVRQPKNPNARTIEEIDEIVHSHDDTNEGT